MGLARESGFTESSMQVRNQLNTLSSLSLLSSLSYLSSLSSGVFVSVFEKEV
jgi:hypothetical protein